MTDQTIPDVTDEERMLAREWAEFIESRRGDWTDRIRAAARVLQALLPPPPRPTLADMTEEERDACQWMQCEVTNSRGKWILATPSDEDGDAGLVSSYGDICWLLPGRVTPRPDLPRMEWPDADQGGEEVTKVDYVSVAGGRTAYGPWTVARLRKKADPAPALPDGWRLADHKENGRVIVTNPTPSENGIVYYVIPTDDPMGYDWLFCAPDELTYIDQEAADAVD